MSYKEKVRFKSMCPVKDCTNQNVIDWKHPSCGNYQYINEDAYIICDGPYSSCSPRFFFKTRFNCGEHTTSQPAEGSEQALAQKLSMLGMNKYGGKKGFFFKVMDKLLGYIEEHEETYWHEPTEWEALSGERSYEVKETWYTFKKKI